MAIIHKNKQSFRWQPAVMEIDDHIVIDSQVYDSATLAPIPFRNLDINSYSTTNLIGKTTWTYYADEGNWHVMGSSSIHGGNVGPNTFVVDNNDSSIGYIIPPRDDSTYLRFHKINLNTHELMTTTSYNDGSSDDYYSYYRDYPGQCYFVYQDDDYLYFLHKSRSVRRETQGSTIRNDGQVELGWVDKTTMTFQGWDSVGRMRQITYIGNKGTTLFYIQTGVHWDTQYVDSRNQFNLYKFDTGTKADTNLVSDTITETFMTFGIASRPFDAGSDIWYGYWVNRSDSAAEGYRISKYELDMNAETATISGCTYDFGATDRAATLTRHDSSNYNHKVEAFTCDDGTSKYVNFVVHETPGYTSQTLDCFKIHTFLIGGADNSHLTYKSTANPGFRIRGIMPLEDDYTKFIIFGDSHSEVWTWNDGTETYELTSTINMSCRGAMVDSSNRLWMIDEVNNVHLLSNFSPLTITVTPENTSYTYSGSTINSYVNVSAYDVDNTRIATNVKLVLEGSTYFTDDSQVKEITTSASAETQVNIKITGTSYTRVLASVVV
jgi:hypothetical protein